MANGKEVFNNSPEVVSFTVHNETAVGERDGETFEKKFTKEDISSLDTISTDKINELKAESNTGAFDYDINEYSLDGQKIISVTTTEDLGFGHGYESSEHTYLLKEEEEKKVGVDMTPFKDCPNVSEGNYNEEIPDKESRWAGVSGTSAKSYEVSFTVQDTRVFGIPDPDREYLNQRVEDIAKLNGITIDEIKSIKDYENHSFTFKLYPAFGETIVWIKQVDQESYFEGHDIYNHEYRLIKPNDSKRVDLE